MDESILATAGQVIYHFYGHNEEPLRKCLSDLIEVLIVDFLEGVLELILLFVEVLLDLLAYAFQRRELFQKIFEPVCSTPHRASAFRNRLWKS
jgi:hypothetical protein